MKQWENKTGCFSEWQRWYKGLYLEIDFVYDDKMEISLFTGLPGNRVEIYCNLGWHTYVVRVSREEAEKLFPKLQDEMVKMYEEDPGFSEENLKKFKEKYHLSGWSEVLGYENSDMELNEDDDEPDFLF